MPLFISSKKSYCPWGRDNVARVERDERLHLQKQEQERTQQRHEASLIRRQALMKLTKSNQQNNKELGSGDDTSGITPNEGGRFCLFDDPESKQGGRSRGQSTGQPEASENVSSSSGQRYNNTINHKPSTFGSLLSEPASRHKATTATMFLETPPGSSNIATEYVMNRNEIKRKRAMDPMANFHPQEEDERYRINDLGGGGSGGGRRNGNATNAVAGLWQGGKNKNNVRGVSCSNRNRKCGVNDYSNDDDRVDDDHLQRKTRTVDKHDTKQHYGHHSSKKRKRLGRRGDDDSNDNDDGGDEGDDDDKLSASSSSTDDDEDHRRRKRRKRRKGKKKTKESRSKKHCRVNRKDGHYDEKPPPPLRKSSVSPSIEELRQRREKREALERQRQTSILMAPSSNNDSSFRRYNNQYHPSSQSRR